MVLSVHKSATLWYKVNTSGMDCWSDRPLFPPEIVYRHIQVDSLLQIERMYLVSIRNSSRIRPIIVMNVARERGELFFHRRGISIYLDFNTAVQKKHKLFTPVKNKPQVAGVRYAMHIPATLCVEYRGSKMSLQSPTEAQVFLNGLETDSRESQMKWLRDKWSTLITVLDRLPL